MLTDDLHIGDRVVFIRSFPSFPLAGSPGTVMDAVRDGYENVVSVRVLLDQPFLIGNGGFLDSISATPADLMRGR